MDENGSTLKIYHSCDLENLLHLFDELINNSLSYSYTLLKHGIDSYELSLYKFIYKFSSLLDMMWMISIKIMITYGTD